MTITLGQYLATLPSGEREKIMTVAQTISGCSDEVMLAALDKPITPQLATNTKEVSHDQVESISREIPSKP